VLDKPSLQDLACLTYTVNLFLTLISSKPFTAKHFSLIYPFLHLKRFFVQFTQVAVGSGCEPPHLCAVKQKNKSKIIKHFFMKSNIIALVIAVLAAAPAMANNVTGEPAVRQFIVQEQYDRIVINGNAQIVLTEAASQTISVEGEKDEVAGVTFKTGNGVLTVNTAWTDGKTKTVIYIPVSHLSKLDIHGSAQVTSANTLKSEALEVLIDGACKIKLRVNGKVYINEAEGYSFDFAQYPSAE
jgi:hypothetical protein